MKKWNRLCLILIALCLVVFFGYRAWDQFRTDTTAPKIDIGTEIPGISVHDPDSVLLKGVIATDKHDGDVTDSLLVERVQLADPDGTVNVTCVAFDAAGNVAKSVRTVRFTDYKSPKFTFTAPLSFAQNSNFEVLDIVQVEDVVDGDISTLVRATSLDEASLSSQGTHNVEFKVTNSLGDTAEIILPVEVYPAGVYNATLTLTDYLIRLPKDAKFNARKYLESFTHGTTTVSLQNGLPANWSLTTSGEVDTRTPGVYSVGYTITNDVYTAYTRLIVIVEG